MRALALPALATLIACPVLAEKPRPLAPGTAAGADWSPQRATGPRDVFAAGDSVNAWATAQADAGAEWLTLTYAEALPIAEIRIWQNDAPGAIARVTVTVDGREVEVWKGRDAVGAARAPVEKVVTLAKPYLGDTVTVHLDTARVSGWNEIDAVEIVGADGRRAWAASATASSTYATAGGAPVHPLGHLLGKAITVRVDGETVAGTVTGLSHDWITLRAGARTVLVGMAHAAVIEWQE